MITRVKGTQDFLDLTLFNFIIAELKKHVVQYNFHEIATPIIEPLELFHRSLGLETDVVTKEMFIIEPRTADDERICLRPEATASTVRAFIQNAVDITPWKVFSYGPMFRYERPQKGRFRQFHQATIEVIGSSSVMQDVQLIKMLDRFFHEKLMLNNYAVLVNFLGTLEDRARYRAVLKAFLDSDVAARICPTCQIRKETNLMRIFDCKTPECQALYARAPRITDHLSPESEREWQELQQGLSILSVSYVHAPYLVRGLDYYSKTVFEFVSANLGAQNAFCGGGRYDQLVSMLGSRYDQPSVGAALGLERLMLLLEPMRDRLPLPEPPGLITVMPFSHAQQPLALMLADELQAHGLVVDVLLDYDSIKSMMRHANKVKTAYALLIGPDEQAHKTATIRNMATGSQITLPHIELVPYFTKNAFSTNR